MAREIGKLIRSHRLRRGLTQRQLADLSTVSVRAIRDLESGRAHRPRPDTVRLIADGLGLSGGGRAAFEAAARVDVPDHVAATGPPTGLTTGLAAALPAPLGVMVGRDTERAELRALLASGAQRLVTLTGLSGIGKTRLAMDVASTLRDVDGLAAGWGTDVASLGVGIGGPPAVLVLDGVDDHAPPDHVLGLLHRHGDLRVLCTARSPLMVPGERVMPLGPLAVPGPRTETDPHALSRVPAVALLLHHVGRVRPGFRLTTANSAAVAALVRGLAGVPVLLEAAAGWFLVYEPGELLSYLRADPLGFVTGRLADWHDAVSTAVAGLDAPGLAVLSALADRAAARSVADLARRTGRRAVECAAALGRLVLLGLVTVTRTAPAGRFRMLEPVRAVWSAMPDEAAGTAAVLPLRLPVPAVRAG